MKPLQALGESLAPVIDLVYPPRCPLCGDGIERQDGLCLVCWQGLVLLGEPCCAICQRPLPDAALGERVTCGPCLTKAPRHSGIYAATLYNDASRKLVLAFKHGRRIALARLMAQLMVARLPEMVDGALVVPVPLHRRRLWVRGYNQAALLAQEIAKRKSLPVLVDGLQRTKATPSLGGLGRKARERALAGAVRVNPHHARYLSKRDILLIDDVVTSGATSERCVSALLKAGAASVRIASFARVLSEIEGEGNVAGPNETPEAARTPGAT